MSSRREPPAGPSRPTSPFPRRPSVSTHQPPPSTPQFGREPQIAYVASSARTGEVSAREFPHNVPKGPKALYNNNNNPPILPSSGAAGGGGGAPPAHSPHKSSFPPSSATLSPHHGGHGHHYSQPGGQGPSARGSVPPPGPRAAVGRGVPAMPSAGQSRSPISAPGSGGIATSGGPVFASSYATSNESDNRIYRGRRSSEWDSGSGIARGGRGRSRERDYQEYGRGGGSDYGARGAGAFGVSFRDSRDRDFREGRGGYRGRSREREVFQHRARSSSRERERGLSSVYPGGRGERDRSERGGFVGDRRPGFDRERAERERDLARERERERERDRERERERERLERERFPYKPLDRDNRDSRVTERSREVREVYDSNRGDREREKRERDAAEYNRNREAERARFSSSALPHTTPSGTPPPSVPAYHGGYPPALGPTGPSSYSPATQQPQNRVQSYQGNGPSTPGQWNSSQHRRSVSGVSNTLPLMAYRDRDKDYDKERTERDVTGKVDYRLDTRSDRAPPPKKEPTEDGKLHSPSSVELKVPTPSTTNAPSTGITPVSATSSRYSPPPSQPSQPPQPPQPPSGPRLALPPTGPRGGPPPTGPRAGVDTRKDADRKWSSKERGGSVEHAWNNAPPSQPHSHLHLQSQTLVAPAKSSSAGPIGRLDIGGYVHPDRIREIETAEKGEDDRDRNTHIPQHVPEHQSLGTAEPGTTNAANEVWTTPAHPSQRASSAALSAPSRPGSSSSGQGLRNILNPINGPGYGPTSSTQPMPIAPASISSSPTKPIQPPTAPRALQQGLQQAPRWPRGRNYRVASGFGPIVKREVGDDSGVMGGYRNGRGGSMGMNNMGMGNMGRGVDRGRRGSRTGVEAERPTVREDVEMIDAQTHVRAKEEKRPEVSLKEVKDTKDAEVVDAPKPQPGGRDPSPEKLLPPPSQPVPMVKVEDDPEDDDIDDVSLTEADVILKIAGIDKDIESLEKRLVELSKNKAAHIAEVEKIDIEIEHAAKVEAARSPRTMEPEIKALVEVVTDMDLDKVEPSQPQGQLAEDHVMQQQKQELLEQQQEERQQEERVELQLQLQFQQQQKQHDMEYRQSEVIRTPSISPSPTPSVSNSPTSSEAASIETESDESLRNSSNSRHPAHPDLPFFRPGPPMKPSDYGFFQANIDDHENIRELLVAHISEERKAAYEKETSLKRKFKELWEPWFNNCQEMDKESTRKKKGASEPAEIGVSPAITGVVASEAVGRRAGRNAPSDVVRSEAEMEQVLKGLAEEEQQKMADLKTRDQNAREAVVPDMIMDPSEMLVYKDTNRLLRTNDDVLEAFRYDVPADDWSDMEQKTFCERYAMFPKQWGKIAQGFDGRRDFKACILHYYMTKKTCNYKELVRGPGKRGRTKGRRKQASSQRTRQSALIADLGRRGGVGEDDEGADSEDVTPAAMTETGRPKRAAAPTFGVDANNNNNNLDSDILSTNGKRGSRESKGGDDDAEKAERGTKRTRGGNNTGREKGQKRVKTPANVPVQPAPSTPALAPVPEKIEKKDEKKKEDLRERESDAVSALTGMGMSAAAIDILPEPVAIEDKKPVIIQQLNPQIQVPIEQPPTPHREPPTLPTTPVPLPPPTTPTPKKEKGERAEKPVAQTSSYWSVPEQSDFPHLLASFGTNWAQISQRLASKTTVMVRNFYTRQVESGKMEYKEIAEGADRKIKAGEAVPEPPKPAALPKKRYESTVVTPRMLIANADPSATPPPQRPGTPGPPVISSVPSTPTPAPVPAQVQVQLQVQPTVPMQSSPLPHQTPIPIKEEVVVKVQQPVMQQPIAPPPQLQAQPQPLKSVETPLRRPHSSSNPLHPPAQLQQPAPTPVPVQIKNLVERTPERPQGRPLEGLQERFNNERQHERFQDRGQPDRMQGMSEKFQERPLGRMHERPHERPQERLHGRLQEGPQERSREIFLERPNERSLERHQPERIERLPQERPHERLQERPHHQSPPVTPQHPPAAHTHTHTHTHAPTHTRTLSQPNPLIQQKLQGQPQQQQQQQTYAPSQPQHVQHPRATYAPESHHHHHHHHRTSSQPSSLSMSQQAFPPTSQQRPNPSPAGPSLEQRHQKPASADQGHQNPPIMVQRHHNPPAVEQRHPNPSPIQQSHQNAPSMHQAQQSHQSHLPHSLQAPTPRPVSAPSTVQQLVGGYQPPLSAPPQALRPQTHQPPANPTPPPSGPSSKRLTSIHSLLNPKEDPPPPRPQSRSTYYTTQTRPQTPQTSQQQQQHHQQQQHQQHQQQPPHSQLQHPQPQHPPQHPPQHQHSQPQHSLSQHSQSQHSQSQPQSLHVQQPRDFQYEQSHDNRQQLPSMMGGGNHALGMPNPSRARALSSLSGPRESPYSTPPPREPAYQPPPPPREPVAYSSAPLREPTLARESAYSTVPPLRESTPQPFPQSAHRQAMPGPPQQPSHQPQQSTMYSRYPQPPPRPGTFSPSYQQGRGPYAPPPSIPPSSHPHHSHSQQQHSQHSQHPHHPQQHLQQGPTHPQQHSQQHPQQHLGSLGHPLQQQQQPQHHYPPHGHNTPPPQTSRYHYHHPGPPDMGYERGR